MLLILAFKKIFPKGVWRSHFFYKNSIRDYRIFEDIFYYLVNKAKKRFGAARLVEDMPPIKISTLFNGEYPEKVNIVSGQVSDRKCIDGLFEDKESIHVFDRGYYDYKWYDKLTEQGIKFVTIGVKNSIIMEERIIDSKPSKDTYDTEGILGSTTSKNLTTKSLSARFFTLYLKYLCT